MNDNEYEAKLERIHRYEANSFVMDHTLACCEEDPELAKAVASSIAKQKIYREGELDVPEDGPSTRITLSHKRTFEAAMGYAGKKVVVLNFANYYHCGGSPWSANAQEECLCRVSTLYPCIHSLEKEYYQPHGWQRYSGQIDDDGGDEAIYTPGIIVFKEDNFLPKMLKKEKRYEADVLTVAAPMLRGYSFDEAKYVRVMSKRVRRILEIAKDNGAETLILGAFGCGAFQNPPEMVAKIFRDELRRYRFDTVEFAIYDKDPERGNYAPFAKMFGEEA